MENDAPTVNEPLPRKKPGGLPKNVLVGLVTVGLSVTGASAMYLLVKHQGVLTDKKTLDHVQQLEKDYEELKQKYADLEIDRNNVLVQTKGLLAEKTQWAEAQEQFENLKKTNHLFMEQKEKLLADNQKLESDLAALIQNFDGLKESYQELQTKEENAEKESAGLRTLLQKQVEASPQYKKLDRESKRLREENHRLGETIGLMDARLKKALQRINKDQRREVNQVRQVREQKLSLDALRAQNTALTKTNEDLNELIRQAPQKIRDMAAQNKTLLRETAEMHYNMGVFFTENKEFSRAEKEYLRALDFDPNNTRVHYNLGYLYAEDLNKQERALDHLEKFLQLDPNSRESEAVRSYITTFSVWNQGTKKR